jgi:hypothetical protein
VLMRGRGEQYVPVDAVRSAVLERGKSLRSVALAAGRSESLLRPGKRKSVGPARMHWWQARRVAEVLGIDPTDWPPTGPRRSPRRGRQWIRRKPKPTGGRWDEANSRLYLFLDEFARVADGTVGTKYDAAYEHLYAVRDLIRREMGKA